MYMCVYTYVCTYVCIYVYTYIHTYINIYIYVLRTFLDQYVRNLIRQPWGLGQGSQMFTPPNQKLTFHFISLCSIFFLSSYQQHNHYKKTQVIWFAQNLLPELCFANTAQEKALYVYISSHLCCQGPRTLIRLLDFPSPSSH